MLRAAVMSAGLVLLGGCQSAPPTAAPGTTTTIGDTTVTTGGSVGVEAAYVR
jgi:hypothetical protein